MAVGRSCRRRKHQVNLESRKGIAGGHRVTFVLDLGAGRTISHPGSVGWMEAYQAKLTGKTIRSASGHLIPNLGKAEVKGLVSGQKIAFKSPAASITKPPASTNEMVDGGKLIIMQKLGGMIKRVSASTASDVLKSIAIIEGEGTQRHREKEYLSSPWR